MRKKKITYLFSWDMGITFIMMVFVLMVMMVVVFLMRLIVYRRCNQTLRSCNSCFLGLLVVTSVVENDGESLGNAWTTRVPFPKLWQLSSSISLHTAKIK